jgi:hypothetical protein
MSVELLVNGLPVWSSENTQVYPSKYAVYAWEQIQTVWGKQVAPGSSMLYLGSLSTGQGLTVTLIVRATSNVETSCAYQQVSAGQVEVRCHDDVELITQPDVPWTYFGMAVYSKDIPSIRVVPIGIILP